MRQGKIPEDMQKLLTIFTLILASTLVVLPTAAAAGVRLAIGHIAGHNANMSSHHFSGRRTGLRYFRSGGRRYGRGYSGYFANDEMSAHLYPTQPLQGLHMHNVDPTLTREAFVKTYHW